ncbi:MAG: GNAT family N-acetyltransferase [Candidatus Thorarchaeota archaeon]|jgi:N-acetylglutamate synthase-like GNAT family acetyltransferase
MRKIRPLRESDRDDILEIAMHTWEGHDYLPYSFEAWLKDKNSHTAAITQEGHVIALANLRVIENGKTGWMEGLRVHQDYRGKGVAKTLTNHVVQTAINLQLKRIRYTTATVNVESLHLGESVGMERKFDLAVSWHADPGKISWRSSTEPIKEATSAQLHPDLVDSGLLPYNVVVYDWKALDATPEAFNKIGQTARFWVQLQNDVIKSFSLGFKRDASVGPQWAFTIYASNESGFLDHLSHHIGMASEDKCTSMFGAFQKEFSDILYDLDWAKHEEGEDDDEGEEFALTLLERVL